jgi:polysaccharide export outer membrane protein
VNRSTYAAAGLALFLVGCAPGSNLPPIADYTVKPYRLGSGDQIRIITFGEDQLTGDFRIDDQGQLALPLLGVVNAAGLTTQQLDQSIADKLRGQNLLRDASVSAEVVTYRPIYVLGEVSKPGEYPYRPGMTMLTCVAIAGGFTYRAVQDYAGVVRTTNNKAVEGRIRPNSLIAPNDVIEVFQRRF